jgi:thiamine-monophosphate kinase
MSSRTEHDATVGVIGEHALIERVRRRAGVTRDWVVLGIGDDAAAVKPDRGALDVITTDSLVEDVHFRLDWTSARAIGHKALAVNVSDLAAMGATPRASLLSLALARDFSVAAFDELIDGFVALADETGAPLVGGNITRSPGPLVVNVTVLGAARPRRLLTRGGGRAGDELYVTGQLGAAAAGLAMLRAGVNRPGLDADHLACIERYERPEARVRCGRIAAKSGAVRACVDLSDGLADAARQLAGASGTGVVIDAEAVPVHPGAAGWAAERPAQSTLSLAVSGGDDYELLFAVPPRQRRRFLGAMNRCGPLPITRVGRLTTEPGAWLEQAGGRQPLSGGFVHF